MRRFVAFSVCLLVSGGVCLADAQAPANDAFENARDLGASVPVEYSGTTEGATHTWPEPFGTIRQEINPQTVWFSWTPPADDDYFIDWDRATGYWERGLYSGDSLDSLRKISLGYYGEFKAVAGETIKIGAPEPMRSTS